MGEINRLSEHRREEWSSFLFSKTVDLTRMMHSISCDGHTLDVDDDLPEILERLMGKMYIPADNETCDEVYDNNAHEVIATLCKERAKKILSADEVTLQFENRRLYRAATNQSSN